MKKILNEIAKYFNGVRKETSRIRWTSGKDLISASTITIVFMICLGVYFYAIDLLITLLRSVAA